MKTKMTKTKIVLTGGGSGGHVTPLVALAKELRRQNPGVELIYYGALGDKLARDQLSGLVDGFRTMPSGKLRRYGGFKGLQKLKLWKSYLFNLRDLGLIALGLVWGVFRMVFDRPDVVFSKGGYPALPACIGAGVTRTKLITHDSDSVLGLTHKLAGRFIDVELLGSPKTAYSSRQKYVGVPIKHVFAEPLDAKAISQTKIDFNLDPTSKLILVTGGGNGAKEVTFKSIEAFAGLDMSGVSMLLTAGKYCQEAQKLATNPALKVVDFTDRMPDLIRSADVVVTRAGATSLAELSAAGSATIILPNALLTGGHQTHNTAIFQEAEAALVLPSTSDAVDASELTKALNLVLNSNNKADELRGNIAKLSKIDATEVIAKLVLEGANNA